MGAKPQKTTSVSKPPTKSVQQPTIVPQPSTVSTYDQSTRPKVDKMMNCFLCKSKDGKNLNTGTSELKYHISVCVYLTGGFLKYLPHGQACGEEAGLSDLEEYGSKYNTSVPLRIVTREQLRQ